MEPGTHALQVIVNEYRRLKAQAEKAIGQVDDAALSARLDEESNSIAMLIKHLAGNMKSRWTEFETTDGEKPTRNRDAEFEDLGENREALVAAWEEGWGCAFAALETLSPRDAMRIVKIRGEDHTVAQAIGRNLVHAAEHVGQIVLLAKHFAGDKWQTLSIPRKRT